MTRNLFPTAINQATIGFDHLFNELERLTHAKDSNFPPYNIIDLGGGKYQLTMAVAGFKKSDIVMRVTHGKLTIKGNMSHDELKEEAKFVHRGLAFRDFTREFHLADDVEVVEAELTDGLLHVTLQKLDVEESAKVVNIK